MSNLSPKLGETVYWGANKGIVIAIGKPLDGKKEPWVKVRTSDDLVIVFNENDVFTESMIQACEKIPSDLDPMPADLYEHEKKHCEGYDHQIIGMRK
jgi:hypothetical protein